MPPVRSQVEKRNFWRWHTATRKLAILKLKPSNCWKRITFGGKLQEKTKNEDFSDSWQHGGVIITCTLHKSHRLVLSWIHVASETKAWKKHGTINWKLSNARKTQNFTCWALTKIRAYCLRTLKPTGYHICWKLWMSRFALRKKQENLENRHHKTKVGNSESQTVNMLNYKKFLQDCYTRKERKWGE